ncbi:unnamed protein product, partial [Mesorhabditis spiculigera]
MGEQVLPGAPDQPVGDWRLCKERLASGPEGPLNNVSGWTIGPIDECSLEATENLLKGIAQVLNEEQRLLIYKLLIVIFAVIETKLSAAADEDEAKMLKSVRNQAMGRMRQYVLAFAQHEWNADQVRALWKWAVVPYVEIRQEGERTLTVAISSVLGLIEAMSEMPKLFHLLVARIQIDDVETCPLKIMVDSLLWEKTVPKYIQMVRTGLVSMLEFADETPEYVAELEYLPYEQKEGINLGTSLLVTQLDTILEYVARTLEGGKRGKASVDGDNLKILSELAPFIHQPAIAERFTLCLLIILDRKKKDAKPELIAKMLNTLAAIVRNLERPAEIYLRLPKLFVAFEDRQIRAALSELCNGLSENPNVQAVDKTLLSSLRDLESWNPRRLDEPDYERRALGYAMLSKIFREATARPHVQLLCAVIQSTAHTLAVIDDIALRAQASLNLRDLIDYLPKPGYDEQELLKAIDHQLLPMIVRGFKQPQQNVRDEFIRALHVLVCAFPGHPHMAELGKTRNVENPDRDFFENAVHIQIGRRRAAFADLAEDIEAGKIEMNAHVMVDYLIPLLRHYMLDVNEKMSSVSDASLLLLVAVLKRTPWNQYIRLLDLYINQLAQDLENEKAFIRIVCAVLDAFHFKAMEDEAEEEYLPPPEIDEEPMEVDEPPAPVEEEEAEKAAPKKLPKVEKPVSPKVVYDKVVKNLLPKLKLAINGKLNPKSKDVHKLAMDSGKKHFQEDDDVRRAPITLAAVKLLLKLPPIILKHQLHGVILKLVELLVARSDRVRDTARKVATQVVLALGPKYFPFVIKEMKHVMKRGFQVHVLIYTTNMLMGVMRDRLKPGDLDACLEVVMELCCEDLFYAAAEEKEIDAIKANVPEAKARRTMDTVENVGRFVGTSSLRTVLEPLYLVVDKKPTAKAIQTVGELLMHMAVGVKENPGIPLPTLLIFCHQLLEEHVAKMTAVQNKRTTVINEAKGVIKPESCCIIPMEPRRLGEITKQSLKSRSHVFVEYGLQIMAFLLQNKKFDPESSDDAARLDPFVSILAQCLTLKYDKVTSLALRCVYRMLMFPLPSLHSNTKSLTERLFVILADYSALGGAGNKQAVLELNQLLFKTFTGLIKISTAALLDDKHIELLLNYVATDVMDSAKQATAFALLKTIIAKEIKHPLLVDVVKLLRQQAVVSDYPSVQAQCRVVISAFIQHPQARKPKLELEWWLDQLEYEHEGGRLSAAEMLNTLFTTLLPERLEEVALIAVVKLGAQLVNDPSIKCRRYCSLAIRSLLAALKEGSRNEIFSAAVDWLDSENEANFAVAAGVISQLAGAEESRFANRSQEAFSQLLKVLAADDALEELAENTILSLIDAMTQILEPSKSLEEELAIILKSAFATLGPYCRCSQEMDQVRLAASAFIGQGLPLIGQVSMKGTAEPSAMELCDWMVFQLRASTVSEATAEQAIKNLIYLCECLGDEDWKNIVDRLAKVCQHEMRKLPDSAIRRLGVFKLCAGLALKNEGERLTHLAETFMPALARELMKKSAKNTEELCDMAMQVSEVLKKRIGEAAYAELLARASRALSDRIEERKILKKEKAIHQNPEELDKERKKRTKKKADARKRKIDTWKPYRVSKRQRVEKFREAASDED